MAFDGIDDLEEEDEEDEDELRLAARKARRDSLLSSSRLGDGLIELERLWEKYQEDGKEPELDEDTREDLYDLLSEEVPRCPDVAQVVWVVKVLEDMELDDDELFEEFAEIIKERADELEPQALLDVTRAYGMMYWADNDLQYKLCDMTRKHLPAFTQKEICSLSVGLNRLGFTDDTRNAGLVFEILKRVNLPKIKDTMEKALNRDGRVYEEESARAKMLASAYPDMDPQFRKQLMSHMDYELEQTRKWQEEQTEKRRELQELGLVDPDFQEAALAMEGGDDDAPRSIPMFKEREG